MECNAKATTLINLSRRERYEVSKKGSLGILLLAAFDLHASGDRHLRKICTGSPPFRKETGDHRAPLRLTVGSIRQAPIAKA